MSELVQPDYATATRAQQRTWAAGDFSVLALSIVPVAEALVEAADPHAGQRVLDVACGSGNVALAAARRYCEVTALDYVPSLLERGRERSAAEGTEIQFVEGDAQALPFEAESFDCVLSSFGVMFAPDQEKAASELVRVCRRGGTIALANWPPDGVVGDLFRCMSKYSPPSPGLNPPTRWGTRQGIRELFGDRAEVVGFDQRIVTEYFRSIEHAVTVFRTYFGPAVRAFEALDPSGQQTLARELATEFDRANSAKDGTVAMPLGYVQVTLRVS